jgi:hypothetical protein
MKRGSPVTVPLSVKLPERAPTLDRQLPAKVVPPLPPVGM